jgi:hypothetical protein
MIQPRIQRILRAPEAIGGAIGLVLGFATAVGLILAGEAWYTRLSESRYWFIYWPAFPMGNLIAPTSTWRGIGDPESGFLFLSTALNGLFWGAAGTAVVRAMRRDGPFRRTLLFAGAVELPLLMLLAITGIKSPFFGPDPLASAATLAHAPGDVLLTRLGLCCHLQVSDVWSGPVVHLLPVELFLLGTSNLVMLVAGAYAAGALWRWTRRRRGADTRAEPNRVDVRG